MKKTYEIKISKDMLNPYTLLAERVAEYEQNDEYHIINLIQSVAGYFVELKVYHGEAYKHGALKEKQSYYSDYHYFGFNVYEDVFGEYEINCKNMEIVVNVVK